MSAILRWYKKLHGGGQATIVANTIPSNALLESTTGDPLFELTTGEYLTEIE